MKIFGRQHGQKKLCRKLNDKAILLYERGQYSEAACVHVLSVNISIHPTHSLLSTKELSLK